MTTETAKLYGHHKRHLEDLKTQIARCLDKEMSLKLEERRDRARQLGIDWMIAQQQQKYISSTAKNASR
jgi:hypothetical protein